MSLHLHNFTVALCGLLTILLAWPSIALADCSDARVKRLARQGNTVASIAKTCEMSKDDIQSILDDDSASDNNDDNRSAGSRNSQTRIPSGMPASQCACWGPASPGMRIPNPQGQSGYARASMCNAFYPFGGYQWQGICE